jgi:hypothetical protein
MQLKAGRPPPRWERAISANFGAPFRRWDRPRPFFWDAPLWWDDLPPVFLDGPVGRWDRIFPVFPGRPRRWTQVRPVFFNGALRPQGRPQPGGRFGGMRR